MLDFSLRQRGTSGKHLGKPPYGYRCDPNDKDKWILDGDAAPFVKRIFDLCIDGKGPEQISRILEKDQVLTTKALYASRKGKPLPKNPYGWSDQSIVGILERQEYTGCTCNFKTYSKSYKLKKRIPNNPEDMFIVPDTQEAIVSQAQWDRVQELRKNKRRPVKAERQGLFAGLVYCADCGSKLHFATCKGFEGKQDHYRCSKYKSGRGECSAHYIREDVLRELVLERIQAVNAYIRSDVEGFQEEWLHYRRADQERDIREDQKRVEQARKRLSTLDVVMSRLYEDYALSEISKEKYKVKGAEFYREHAYIDFNTLYENGRYVIFAVAEVDIRAGQPHYLPFWHYSRFDSVEAFNSYVETARACSLYHCTVDVQPGDRLLTLSTCTGTDDNLRLVVMARKVREGENQLDLNMEVMSTYDR